MTDPSAAPTPAQAPTPAAAPAPTPAAGTTGTAAMQLTGLTKHFGQKLAVDALSLTVPEGSFYGLVGPNGAGKTTTLSMATGLLRPDAGQALVHGVDMWRDPIKAKALIGNLADGVKLFDRLSGEQLVTYNGLLFGLDRAEVADRVADLLRLLDLESAAGSLVVDYSAGMTKKIALACALVHAPRVLVLDEPFESVDPVSAANIRDILTGYVQNGGTVIVSSHVMDLVQRMCDHVAVVANGRVLVAGTVDEVRGGSTLEDRFVELVGGRTHAEGPEWLRRS
ncbi:ABC transporter ATP-binding protein [Herbiconiux solani]|uniref:ABC transporter ATP-binding protein n=1 Tax=Herbiconiux solani TaxID=661329 RepID=UPI0009FDC2B5|nr:ABC transporter ATP-binding protein [Herbiconiux solani]